MFNEIVISGKMTEKYFSLFFLLSITKALAVMYKKTLKREKKEAWLGTLGPEE